MERDDPAYLFDIIGNCDLIFEFIRETNLDGYRGNS